MKRWIENASRRVVESCVGSEDTVVVSISSPGMPVKLLPGWGDVLRLEFDDYDPTSKVVELSPEFYSHAQPFTEEMAWRVVTFLRTHQRCNWLIHCEAGLSRSGAIVEALGQAFPERDDLGAPRVPNPHVLRLMKRELGLVPRGAERK